MTPTLGYNRAMAVPPPTRRERIAWTLYDFANSGYTTVVLTAVFNAYFVGVVAPGAGFDGGTATLLWTLAVGAANALVLLSAPLLGAIADHGAHKKRYLVVSSLGCILGTVALGQVGPGDVWLGMTLVILATYLFAAGENLIAAFLPELAPQAGMGRLSGYGWAVGYLGGLSVLALCLAYVRHAQAQGLTAADYVPGTLYITAAAFALGALPTFLWLRERAVPSPTPPGGLFRAGLDRLRDTWGHARRHRDLFRLLSAIAVYHCGINTVIVLAAVFAQAVLGFTTEDSILLILVVNVTAAAGAFVFGHLQDRIGSVRTLVVTLVIWIAAVAAAILVETRAQFWWVANAVGIALGASQSAGRALVGQFSPPARAGEFFGLWGLAVKLSAIVGPVTYGLVNHFTGGDHRIALLSTLAFFVAGLILLRGVDEARGERVAREEAARDAAG